MTILNGYCSLTDAKNRVWPSGAEADAFEDILIEEIVMVASRQIDTDTDRRFYTTTVDETRYYKPLWFDCVIPDDIVSVTSLATDPAMDGSFSTVWATTDYDLLPYNAALDGNPYNHIITRPNGRYTFPAGFKSVKVVG